MQRHQVSKYCWTNGTERLARGRVGPNPRFEENRQQLFFFSLAYGRILVPCQESSSGLRGAGLPGVLCKPLSLSVPGWPVSGIKERTL